jgi:hypothetical protein
MATNLLGEVGVPESITQWKKAARKHRVLGTINQLGSQAKVSSASKFQYKHFIGLRVLYRFEKNNARCQIPKKIARQFSIPATANMALDKSSYWNSYLTEIRNFNGSKGGVDASYVPESLGPFVNVWLYQKHIILGDYEYADMSKVSKVSPVAGRTRAQRELRASMLETPTRVSKSHGLGKMMKKISLDDSERGDNFEEILDKNLIEEDSDDGSGTDTDLDTPYGPHDDDFNTPGLNTRGQPIKDEQTVNVFLLAFLSALTATTVPFHTRWLAERNAMVYQKEVRYVARTDGHLRDEAGRTFSLIEVKPRRRKRIDVSIRMQESAQMAAWLTQNVEESHDPYEDCR